MGTFEACCGANEWKEDAKKLQQLIPLPSNPAFDFYCRLDESTTKTNSTLRKALEDGFDAPGLQQNYAIEFNNQSREKDETLEAYVDELRGLARRAYPD